MRIYRNDGEKKRGRKEKNWAKIVRISQYKSHQKGVITVGATKKGDGVV